MVPVTVTKSIIVGTNGKVPDVNLECPHLSFLLFALCSGVTIILCFLNNNKKNGHVQALNEKLD